MAKYYVWAGTKQRVLQGEYPVTVAVDFYASNYNQLIGDKVWVSETGFNNRDHNKDNDCCFSKVWLNQFIKV